jgi:tetratricopeptide (TPR) repeat protein
VDKLTGKYNIQLSRHPMYKFFISVPVLLVLNTSVVFSNTTTNEVIQPRLKPDFTALQKSKSTGHVNKILHHQPLGDGFLGGQSAKVFLQKFRSNKAIDYMPFDLAFAITADKDNEVIQKIIPSGLQINQYSKDTYNDDLSAIRSQMADTDADTVSRFMVQIELAEFFLSHLMIKDGIAAISDIPEQALSDAEREYYYALKSALYVSMGTGFRRGFIPEDSEYSEWSDYAFWTAIHYINSQDFEASKPFLEKAFIKMQQYPDNYMGYFSKLLLEAAIKTGKWNLSKEIVENFDEHPHLKVESFYHFLIGLASQKIGKNVEAFDAYRIASKGNDVFAQRARLGIVEIGIETSTMPVEDAISWLESSRLYWRGDQYEIEVLIKISDLNIQSGNTFNSLVALGNLYISFPNSSAFLKRKDLVDKMLNEFYLSGFNGKTNITDFIQSHKKLASMYRFYPGFEDNHRMLAEKLNDIGATGQSAFEYGALSEHLEIIYEENIREVSIQDIWDLKLRQAESLFKGGQYRRVVEVLANRIIFDDESKNELSAEILAKSAIKIPDISGVLGAGLNNSSANNFRMRAEALSAIGDYKGSKIQYQKMREKFKSDFTEVDMINMLLSAHRDDDVEATMRVAEDFPSVVKSSAWINLAKGLRYTSAPITPLSQINVDSRLSEAEEYLKVN